MPELQILYRIHFLSMQLGQRKRNEASNSKKRSCNLQKSVFLKISGLRGLNFTKQITKIYSIENNNDTNFDQSFKIPS